MGTEMWNVGLRAILKEYFDAHQEDLATAETVTSPERTTGKTLPVENGNVHGGRTSHHVSPSLCEAELFRKSPVIPRMW
jgi:hypothetical protein